MYAVYMAHPVGGAVVQNLERAKRWVRWLELFYPEFAIVAPWIVECEVFDDNDPEQRRAGMDRRLAVLERCRGLVLVGGRISDGMTEEIEFARKHNIPIADLIHLGPEPPCA